MLLIINGASGAGKTTAAQVLVRRISSCTWVHPDERWDTPNMDSESILRLAAMDALVSGVKGTTIVDCQIRPMNIATVLWEVGIACWLHVMLFCPRSLRHRRLRERGWNSTSFDTIENWASILRAEATAEDDLVIDTSRNSTDHVREKILLRYEEWTRVGA